MTDDIMIDDWFLVNGTSQQIICVEGKGKDCVVRTKSGYICFANEIKPIKLTQSILKRSDFYPHYTPSLFSMNCELFHDEDRMIYHMGRIQYVHELQHFLRMANAKHFNIVV